MTMQSLAKETFIEGGKGAIVNYVYDEFVGPKVGGALGSFAGNYSDAAISLGVALAIAHFGKGKWAEQGRALFAHRAAIALETNFGGGSGASPFGQSGGTWYNQLLAGR